jgi:hypothetical protein
MTASNIPSIIAWFAASCKELHCLMQRQIASLFREKTTEDSKQI